MDIRMVKFCRSTMLVEICTESGDPAITVRSECVTSGYQATLVYGIGPISELLALSGNCRVF
jgi:hypothetical protein